uniref:Uncharacterized protein n=1 Tax=Aplanochytrium stocchinoi TaxID=215587 RepID=A0A7S3LNP1_9STRA|mmetsp:Transcript_1/g.2  ORF Transcript_1/g.2 Transcript_1/m.2 type:complete len:290 (+) Transcript_1:242-1111(+)|eukprot:CAMPEP_0204834762 /NCGR_PEP_ID=MMETSP1346-20131115/20673_1 /ASSEMBLY_ACC=CAM_ASM_000771 /TAXON_ID=215587 /ORGANISM="Aplanochytrium stocchinoi, Strain GSBS06" /LENGTH=289 /DNA_ID=CAMNT_0051968257 /DNA_START=172 /DNA_END=1041 /DNA_ORIENTATION=+
MPVQDVKKLFDLAFEDLQKAQATLENGKSLQKCANRFIKLSQRLYDIWKIYDEEFESTIDVVAAKTLLLFSRSCFTVSHIILNKNWRELNEKEKGLKQVLTLPRRAARKVAKRTVLRKKYQYQNPKSEYGKRNLSKVMHQQQYGHRVYMDELANVGCTLKDLGLSLVFAIEGTKLAKDNGFVAFEPLDPSVFTLKFAQEDLMMSWTVFSDYLDIFLLDNEGAPNVMNLLPLMEKYGLKTRSKMVAQIKNRGSKNNAGFYEINDTLGDLQKVSKLVKILEEGPDSFEQDV